MFDLVQKQQKKQEQEEMQKAIQYDGETARICQRIFVLLGDEKINEKPLTLGDIGFILKKGIEYINRKGSGLVYRDIERKEGDAPGK